MSRTVVLFPGQGGYLPGALADLARDHRSVAQTLADVDAASEGAAIASLLRDLGAPGLEELASTDPARLHLAVLAAGLAVFRLLTGEYGVSPDLLIGHSLGEITALAAAGVYGLEDAVRIVRLRDEAFAQAPPREGGMVAVSCGYRRARGLLSAVDDWNTVAAADNSPGQVAVSGPSAGLETVRAVAAAVGLRATRLPVPYPFHNHMLAEAAESFARSTLFLRPKPLAVRVYSPLLGRYLEEPQEEVAELLAGHLIRPIGFLTGVRAAHADGYRVFVECGPRALLTGFVTASVPEVVTVSPLRRRADAAGFSAALAESLATMDSPAEGSARRAEPPSASARQPREEILARLRVMYADAVGYPAEVFEPHLDLEADLGVDSIIQTELLARALKEHGSDAPPGSVSVARYATLESIADLLADQPEVGDERVRG
jgi:[acyl-carrier-protein] S-malonyltransferase